MKIRHYLLVITVALTANLTADTIVLKTGKKYEGKVISEDDKSYLVEIHVTKSIKDERRIPKDHVQEIISAAKDALDFEAVKSLVPTPDRLKAESYTARIKTAKDFVRKHPKSKHSKEVKTIIQTLEKEHQTISQGGIKLGGQLISATDLEANAYDVHARIILLDMKSLATKGLYQQALRKWETLQKDYAQSSACKNSMTLAGRILSAHSTELNQLLGTLEAREAKRKSALESLPDSDRDRTVALLAEKQKAYDALIEKEEKQMRTKWLTIDPYNKKALEFNLRSSKSALSSLGNKSNTQTDLAGPLFRGAWSALAKGDIEEAAKLVKKLQAMKLPEKYTNPLAKQLQEKQAIDKADKERAEQERLAKLQAEKEAAEKAAKEAKDKKNGKGKGKRK